MNEVSGVEAMEKRGVRLRSVMVGTIDRRPLSK